MNPDVIPPEDNSQRLVALHHEGWERTGVVLWELNIAVVPVMTTSKGVPYSESSRISFTRIGNAMNKNFKERQLPVTLPNVQHYLEDMKERVMPNTFNTAKNAIKQILLAQPVFKDNYQVRQKIKEFFKETFLPVTVIRNVNEDKYLSYSVLEKLIAYGRNEENVPKANPDRKRWGPGRREEQILRNYKMSLMIEALFQSASRISAFLNIKLSDGQFTHDGFYRIHLSYDKGHQSRVIYLKEDLAREIHRTFKSKVYLFDNERGNRIFRSNFADQLINYAKAAGLEEHVHPHKFRHTFAMARIYGKNAKESVRSDVTAKDVQDVSVYLGHAQVSTTYKYYLSKQINRNTIHNIPE